MNHHSIDVLPECINRRTRGEDRLQWHRRIEEREREDCRVLCLPVECIDARARSHLKCGRNEVDGEEGKAAAAENGGKRFPAISHIAFNPRVNQNEVKNA